MTADNGNLELTGGFWFAAGPSVLVGDLNCDGTVGVGDISGDYSITVRKSRASGEAFLYF